MRYPRYTTFGDEELVTATRTLVPDGQFVPDARTLRATVNGTAAFGDGTQIAGAATGGRRPLIKEQFCPVSYPDGACGICRYVRIGPDWHLFHYRHHGKAAEGKEECPSAPDAADPKAFRSGIPLPTQRFDKRMENTAEAITTLAREKAASAFQEAILHEQKDRFLRITPPHGSKPDPANFQFSAKRAREIGGKYALCHLLEKRLLPDGPLSDTIEEASAAWQERKEGQLLVACACRWTRRWEMPRFNPLYREFPPPHNFV